jgi:arsenate reductase
MNTPVQIYYLCTHNRCRSQIAEAFTKLYGGNRVIVASAGVAEAIDVHPLTVEVMSEVGIDISQSVSKTVDMKFFTTSNVVVQLCEQARERCPVVPFGTRREFWDIDNPIKDNQEADIEDCRRVRDEIHERVKELLDKLGHRHSSFSL